MNFLDNHILVFDLGYTEYGAVWNLQKTLHRLRTEQVIPDLLLLNEHRHVYTFGKTSDEDHLLAGGAELKASGADLFHVDRGGDVTYHGPGQLVAYPILALDRFYHDVHRYVRDLEEVIIRTLATLGVAGVREPGYTGVWVGQDKVAAIGVKVSRWVTMHGLALNCSTDLRYFDRIIPCGIFHRGVTSLQQLLHRSIPVSEVSAPFVDRFGEVFGREMKLSTRPISEFMQQYMQDIKCP